MSEHPEIDIPESEEQLIVAAQTAVSQCNWVVGECAFKWTRKYARGRTDADFGELVGLSGDQVYQRRRVWETFGDVYQDYSHLKWSHFYVALNWDDSPECLQWAEENEATVAEMRAWRRALRGEDLMDEPEPDDWAGDPAIHVVSGEPRPVRDPDTFGESGRERPVGSGAGGDREPVERLAGVARESDQTVSEYAPFRQGAGGPAPSSGSDGTVKVAQKPKPTPAQSLKRMTGAVERMNRVLTPELLEELQQLPEKDLRRFVDAVNEFNSKVSELT